VAFTKLLLGVVIIANFIETGDFHRPLYCSL
jgi:hypothetical protein